MATPPGILTPSFPPQLGIVNVTYLNQEMEEEVKDQFSTPLIITIITLACSLLLVAAIYGCCHQRFSQKKNQVRWEEGWDGHPETKSLPQGHLGEARSTRAAPLLVETSLLVPLKELPSKISMQGAQMPWMLLGWGPRATTRAAEQRPQVQA